MSGTSLGGTRLREKHGGRKRWWWIGTAILCVVAGISVYAAVRPKKPHVTTVQVQRESLQNKIFATGTVKPVNRQIILPTQLTSPIDKVQVQVNQTVKTGDVLLTLANSAQKAALDAAKVAVIQASNALTTAQQEQSAAPIGMQPQFTGTVASAQTSLAQAQSNLAQAQAAYDATFVRAQMDGTVILVNPAGISSDGTASPILEVVGTDKQIVTNVSELDAVHIHAGMQATLTSDAYPNQSWNATVSRVAEFAATGSSGTGQVEVDLQPIGRFDVPLGYDLNIHITSSTHVATLVVPYAALTQGGSAGYSVFVVQNGRVHRVDVTLGITTDTDVEVTKGLTQGQTVVTNPPSSLSDGQAVATS